MQRITVILVLTSFCVGCSGSAYIGMKSAADSRLNNLFIDQKTGANYPPFLVMGTKFIYQDANLSNGKICNVTMVVKQKKEFDKKPAYWIEVSREERNYFDIYDMNLNWIGLFGDGKELESAEPCLQIFKWPLRIGEKWNSEYIFRDYSDYSHGVQIHTSRVDVNIRTYEEVRVPASAFKALRIQAGRETFWYAPSMGWIVKEELGLDGQNKRILELVEYDTPKNT